MQGTGSSCSVKPLRFYCAQSGRAHTVDAVGFHVDEVADFWHNVVYPFRFPDTQISDCVRHARHAITIDDERRTSHPELWNETAETKKQPDRIKHVWFAGVHSNVGGGYPKQGISLVSLVWMMKEAERADFVLCHLFGSYMSDCKTSTISRMIPERVWQVLQL